MSARLRTLAALCASAATVGCAALGGPEPRRLDPEVRPGAPPEYDVLVAQQYEHALQLAEALAAYERALAKDEGSAFLHFKVGRLLERQNRVAEAFHHAQRAVELAPDDLDARIFLGRLHGMRRELEEAEAVLLDEEGAPLDVRSGILLYQIYQEYEQPEQALEVAEGLVRAKPNSLKARLALAGGYQRLQRSEDAERAFREAIELIGDDQRLLPERMRIYHALARLLSDRGDELGAIGVYRQILELHPNHHVTLIALAESQMSRDDLESAIATFEEIERHYPNDLRSMVRLGFLKYEARAWLEAVPRFERFLAVNPEEYEVVYFLGSARRRGGEEAGAIEAFEGIPADHKNYADARTELAAILERRGDYDAALAEVERAAGVSPSRALDLYAATLRAKAGDFEGAVARLEGMLSEQPSDDELLYNLGVVYGEAKFVEESIRYMRLALEQNPDNASALNYVGYTWAERGINLDEAERMIVRALELRPEDGYITDSLGWVYYMRARPLVESGRGEEAREYVDRAERELRRAEELTGGDPVVSEHLGDLFLLRGEKGRALEHFEEAVRLEPRIGEQPHLFEKLEKLRGELR